MEADATEDQRALLEVSSRFIEDVCPLRAVRDGAWKDAAFAAAYRRQAAELGWFSMLVPESLGGGSVSGNGVLDAALIASRRGAVLQPGSFVGTNVVAAVIATAGSDRLKSDVLARPGDRRRIGVVGVRRRGRRDAARRWWAGADRVEASRAGRR